MCLVAPGGKPETWAQKSMSSTSGHIIHLMPGDHKYCTPEIPIVVVWNGLNHYCPTYTPNPESTLKWKMSLISKHISEATSLFGEIEGDLDDSKDFDLCEQFHVLKGTAVQAQKLLAKSHISSLIIPPSHIGPDPRDIMVSLTRSTILQEHPVPAFRGNMSVALEEVVDVAAGANYKVPLFPPLQQRPQVTPGPPPSTTPTETVQSHPQPIASSRTSNIIPKAPVNVQQAEFNIPLGSFLEAKRLRGGKPLGPPKKDTQKEVIKVTKPEVIVSIPLPPQAHPPPQAPVPSCVQSALSQLSSASVQAVMGKGKGVSSKGKASKGKGPLLFKCTYAGCSYSTYNKSDFRIHKDKHEGVRYKCGICPKDFGSLKAKEIHVKPAHMGQHRAACPQLGCNFSHNDHGVTRVHLYVEHGIGEEPKYRHPDCKGRDIFSNFRVYERHKRTYHLPKDHQCPHCVRKFKDSQKLEYHIKTTHRKKETPQCDQCGKFFASSKSLAAHKESQH